MSTLIRYWIEGVDANGSAVGYLLPVGFELVGEEDMMLRANPSRVRSTPNKSYVLEWQGPATNQNDPQTNAHIANAVSGLYGFFDGGNSIKTVHEITYDGTSSLGASVNSNPGSTIRSWATAYTNADARWDIVKMNVTQIILPSSFSGNIVMQNFPLNDVDLGYAGNVRAFESSLSRRIVGGTERSTIKIEIVPERVGWNRRETASQKHTRLRRCRYSQHIWRPPSHDKLQQQHNGQRGSRRRASHGHRF